MYVDVPTKVSAIELMSSPETPKSQILISPLELKRMLEGLMSVKVRASHVLDAKLTAVNDVVHLVEVRETFQDCQCDLADDFNVDGTDAFVDAVKRALVHEFYAHADVRIGQVCAVEGDDVLRVAIVHDLQLAQDLLAHGRLRVDEHNLDVEMTCKHAA